MERIALTSTSIPSTSGRARHAARFSAANRRFGPARAQKTAERQPRPENVDGNFYVDHTCIDCDTCRWMTPDVFKRVGAMSAVVRQPDTPDLQKSALQALVSCPTFSIHAKEKNLLKAAVQGLPLPVEGVPGVFHLGFHSEKSFGGTAYLIRRGGGNIMVDSPRFDAKLLRKIEALGGARYIFLTHKDDVADHAKWAAELGAKRIIHKSEATTFQGTTECEVFLEGDGPWSLPDGAEDVSMIFTPGHSSGHVVLHYRPSQALFTGDHLSFHRAAGDSLMIFSRYCQTTIEQQLASVRKLREVDFLHVLPGHGRRGHLQDATDRVQRIDNVQVM